MLNQNDTATLDAMVDPAVVANWRAVYGAACARRDANQVAIADADKAIKEAGLRRASALAAIARGETADPSEAAKLYAEVQDYKARLQHANDLAPHLHAECERLNAQYVAVQSESLRPVAEHAGRFRIKAAGKIGEAMRALAEAQTEYDHAAKMLNHAIGRGFKLKHGVWGGGEGRRSTSAPEEARMLASAGLVIADHVVVAA